MIRGNPKRGLFGATLGFFIGFAAVALFGPTAQKFNEVMSLTPVMVGFLVAMPSLSGSLLRIPFAAWVDITGGRKPFLVLLCVSILGMAGLTWLIFTRYPDGLTAGMYPLLLALGLLCGCGIATFSVGIGQVSYWFPRSRQGSALGAYAGIGNLAPGLFSLLIPLALSGLGLAWSYLIWLVFLAAGAVLYYFTGLNSPYFQLRSQGRSAEQAKKEAAQAGQEMFPSGQIKDSLLLSARLWKTWVLVALYFTTFGGFLALTSWFPTYWKAFFAQEALAAGFLTALFSITASLVRVAGGSVADRFGGETTTFLALAVLLVGALVMSFSHSFGLSVSAALVMAVGIGVGNAAIFKLVPQEVPQAVGGASGWVGGLGAFGGFVFPPLLGIIARSLGSAGYAAGFGLFAVLAVVSLGLVQLLRKTRSMGVKPATARASK
jgi:NNP family nitrate/nitrite transporter-like MFS transporter